ncbi:MAG TPA: transglutaminaseTgpA domain-containing protein [Fimbriimonadaceae bacterium]|nr:transglutaminaseTgpA domain-containing protein [Fimbriimonadaceae bacterium]
MRFPSKAFADDRLTLLDYVLAALAGMMATYSVGMSLLRPQLGWFFVIAIGLGMMVSFSIQRQFAKRKWIEVGGFIYFLLAMVAVFYSRQLNTFLPEGGFSERELTVASVLAWMILLGSWVSWRDSTLLFQAVPSIALFGLVGAFNTFKGSTVAFFVFLLCLATLFARAHARSMMKQAVSSGFTQLHAIRQGPWRWMAGPEWALASAAVVILISVFGAPILQESVKGVSGLVRIPMPNIRRNPNNQTVSPPGAPNVPQNSVPVGTGPLALPERLVFRAQLDQPRYLRTGSYSTYQRGFWTKVQVDQTLAQEVYERSLTARREVVSGENYETVPFRIAFEGMPLANLPAPGEFLRVNGREGAQVQLDGGVVFNRTPSLNATFEGESAVLKAGATPVEIPEILPEFSYRYVVTSGFPQRILELSDSVTANASTAYEKALAIKNEIERRCKYNLRAEAAPNGVDPVENFLFGDKREGYCDLFASAMVLMARWQGIPARYVRGYYPLNPKENGWYPVTENCAHAWAELYFDEFGWVAFDPTEGAQEVPGGGRGESNDMTPWYQRAWVAQGLNGVIAVSILAAVVVALRSARRERQSPDWTQIELARNYERFAAQLQRASGQPRRPSMTASEYLALVEPKLGEARAEARQVTELFEAALYAPPKGSRPNAEDLRAPVDNFKRTLRAAVKAQKSATKNPGNNGTSDT